MNAHQGLAIASQGIAAGWTPNDHEGVLKSDGTMAPRLMSLTVIILGRVFSLASVSMKLMVNLVPSPLSLYAFQVKDLMESVLHFAVA